MSKIRFYLYTKEFKEIFEKEKKRIKKTLPNNEISNTNYKDIHIHLVEKSNKEYKEKLLFRDFLRKNKKEVERYHVLKQKWEKQAKGNRKKYGNLKVSYIKNIIQKINIYP